MIRYLQSVWRAGAVCSLVVGAFTFYSGWVWGETAFEHDLKELLLSGYRTSASVLHNSRLVYTVFEKPAQPNPKPSVGLSTHRETHEFIAAGNNERLRSFEGDAVENGLGMGTTVLNAHRLLRFVAANDRDPETEVGRAVREDVSGTLFGDDANGPARRLLMDYSAIYGVSVEKLLEDPHTRVGTATQLINGIECYRIDCTIQNNNEVLEVSYWVAPDRSCLPMRLELTGGGVFLISQLVEADLQPSGQWIPSQVTSERGFGRIADGKAESNNFHINEQVTTKSFEFNPRVDEATFDVSEAVLPLGTLYRDPVLEVEFVIGEGPVSEKRISEVVSDALSHFSGRSSSLPTSRPLLDESGINYVAESSGSSLGVAGRIPRSVVFLLILTIGFIVASLFYFVLRRIRVSSKE